LICSANLALRRARPNIFPCPFHSFDFSILVCFARDRHSLRLPGCFGSIAVKSRSFLVSRGNQQFWQPPLVLRWFH
jgi:hypothetical protein